MPNHETNEVFEIVAQVGAEQMGPVIALLTRLGVERVTHRLVEQTLTYKKKTVHDTSAVEFLTPWVADHPTFRAREAVAYFREAGRTDGACYSALTRLCEDKVVKKLGEGMYSRTDVKALPKPKPKQKAVTKRTRKRNEVSGPEFVLRVMSRAHGRMSSATMKKHFEADGRASTGVGPSINNLLGTKRIKRISEGLYELTSSKDDKAKKKPKAVAPPIKKANGAAVEVTTAAEA